MFEALLDMSNLKLPANIKNHPMLVYFVAWRQLAPEAARHQVWLGRGEGVGLILRLS